MQRRVTARGVVCSLLVLVLAAVVFANSWGTFQTDIKPEVYIEPWRMLRRSLSGWLSTPYLGQPNFNVGLLPVLLVTSALRATGLSPELTFKAFHLVLWLVAALGAARLVRRLDPRAGAWAGVVAGTAYLVNPYAVVGGSTLAVALPFALLPWLLIAVIRGVLEPGRWRWPAVIGLLFWAMSGMNVAVVPLLSLIPVPVIAWLVARDAAVPARRVVGFLLRSAAAVVAVSLYWLVPAVAAQGVGSQAAAASETIDGIAKVSSMVEVLRGMGMWTLYGYDANGPWVPQFASYLTSPFITILTLLWPVAGIVLAVLLPRCARRIVVTLVAVGAIGMVGAFPAAGASPLGRLLAWTFESVPLAVAFRTTNKLGGVLTLGLALAIGAGLPRLARRLSERAGTLLGSMAPGLVFVVLFAWVAPAFVGNLYTSPLDIPGYWREAASAADARSGDSRTLLLPGQLRSSYRWSVDRPDDLPNSLMASEAVIPETAPNASAPGANFLAALDDTFQSMAGPPTAVSTMARYLGVSTVLLRHDVVWEKAGGIRPGDSDKVASGDPGLFGVENHGRPGQNVNAAGIAPQSASESILPPLQEYSVRGGRATTRLESMTGSLVVVGDAWALPAMTAAGLLGSGPTFRYLADLSDSDFASTLGSSGRIVVTDTNRRRSVIANRLVGGQGRLLSAQEEPTATRALGAVEDQTTLVHDGARATASSTGGAFFDLPFAGPDNVLDDDPDTAWLFGDFNRAPGMHVDIHLREAQSIHGVAISQVDRGALKIDEVRVRTGDAERTVRLPDTGTANVDLGGARSDVVRVTVVSTRGEGFGLVGIGEVDISGVSGLPVAQVPDTLGRYVETLDATAREAFDSTPVDLVLSRDLGASAVSDDSEPVLARNFSLPDDRTYQPTAWVRVADDSAEARDALAGYDPEVEADASAWWFDVPQFRPSAALDESDESAWLPGGRLTGAWWQVSTPERDISKVVLDQEPGDGTDDPQRADRVEILVDGRSVTRAGVAFGRTIVDLPPGTRGRTVRVEITEASGDAAGFPPRFTTIDTGVGVEPSAEPQCVSVATVDGRPLRMRPDDVNALAGLEDAGTVWVACDPVVLDAGAHELRPVDGVVLDRVSLRDTIGSDRTVVPSPPPEHEVTGGPTDRTIRVTGLTQPVAVIAGQSHDERWVAELDGVDLGVPQVIDGWSSGWIVDDPGNHVIRIRYLPERRGLVALVASGIALLALLVTAVRRPRGEDDSGAEVHIAANADDAAAETGDTAQDHRRLPAWSSAVAVVVASTLVLGWAGLAGAAAALLLAHRVRRVSAVRGVLAGAAAIVVGGLVQLYVTRDTWGTVDADAIARSLWPHWIASFGLALALLSALRHLPSDREETHA